MPFHRLLFYGLRSIMFAQIIDMDDAKAIAEINDVISKIEAELKPGCEIGAREKSTLKTLLKAANIGKETKFFPCRREHSSKIVNHFTRAKGVPQSRFSMNAQPSIFIIY